MTVITPASTPLYGRYRCSWLAGNRHEHRNALSIHSIYLVPKLYDTPEIKIRTVWEADSPATWSIPLYQDQSRKGETMVLEWAVTEVWNPEHRDSTVRNSWHGSSRQCAFTAHNEQTVKLAERQSRHLLPIRRTTVRRNYVTCSHSLFRSVSAEWRQHLWYCNTEKGTEPNGHGVWRTRKIRIVGSSPQRWCNP